MTKLKKTILLGILVGIALIIYIVEAQIPLMFPGMKLGLANVISLTALILFGWKEAIVIMLLRTFLGSVFSGNMSSLLFSLTGGILSNIAMILLYTYFKNTMSICTISIIGAIFHNIGQLLAAGFIINNFNIYLYLPVLMVSGVITGYFIGLVTKYLNHHLNKITLFF